MMLANARQRARLEGLPFDLTKDDIEVPEFCPVLGVKLNYSRASKADNRDYSPSLDKFDPHAGYVKGNVGVVSLKANRLKNQLSPEQLMLFARNYYEYAQRVKEEHLA